MIKEQKISLGTNININQQFKRLTSSHLNEEGFSYYTKAQKLLKKYSD